MAFENLVVRTPDPCRIGADYFLANHRDRLGELLDFPPAQADRGGTASCGCTLDQHRRVRSPRPISRPEQADDIAIIGLSGRYPMADDLEQFWENLRTGKLIIEIPKEVGITVFSMTLNQESREHQQMGWFPERCRTF